MLKGEKRHHQIVIAIWQRGQDNTLTLFGIHGVTYLHRQRKKAI